MKHHLAFTKALIAYQTMPIPAMYDILAEARTKALIELEPLGLSLVTHISLKYQEQYLEAVSTPLITRNPQVMTEFISASYEKLNIHDAEVYNLICKAFQRELISIGTNEATTLADNIKDGCYKKYLSSLI